MNAVPLRIDTREAAAGGTPRRTSGMLAVGLGALVVLLPATVSAQTGVIAGYAHDQSGAMIPGVTVEATSPALIEKVRLATTATNGRYQITSVPIGTYEVTFTLAGFATVRHSQVVVTSDFTANVVAGMKVGLLTTAVEVVAATPLVDVHRAQQQVVFQGEEIRDLPLPRNLPDLLALVPSLTTPRGFNGNVNCVGGSGNGTTPGSSGASLCDPYLRGFNAHAEVSDVAAQAQGRVLIDGIPINAPRGTFETGAFDRYDGITGGYLPDPGGAREVSFTLSGALGESETGGAALNIVPRSGGNRFTGNYFTSYTNARFFDRNRARLLEPPQTGRVPPVPVDFDYDVTGAVGGPVVRDRVWFYLNARNQGAQYNLNPRQPLWRNKNEGIWGMNYQPDRTRPLEGYRNEFKNGSLRLTVQPTPRHTLNLFWDEQSSCLDPCYGVTSSLTSAEAATSVQTWPNRLLQIGWTNPMTSRLLLDGALSATMQHYDTTRHRGVEEWPNLPRIQETGLTVGIDEVSFNQPGSSNTLSQGTITSGSIDSTLADSGIGAARLRNSDTLRSRLGLSVSTGTHSAKLGYEGAYFMEKTTPRTNDARLTLVMGPPICTVSSCGNTSLYFPDDPNNTKYRRPVPTSFRVNTGPATLDERVWFGALFVQDQWTFHRVTLSGALRYDHAQSRYGRTCVGGTGNEPYVPVQSGGAYDGQRVWCTEPSNGVNYNDITPRWNAAWDVFGTGKTSLKVNMGKFLSQAAFGGVYSDVNPAARTAYSLTRSWTDTNGNRIPDCRVFDLAEHFDLGDTCNALSGNAATRYGRDPSGLDAAGLNASLFLKTWCGRHDRATQLVQDYCAASGRNLVGGWGARQYEWQFGLGVQHELLPRLTLEATFNRRRYGNLTQADVLGRGCDRFGAGAVSEDQCQTDYLDFTAAQYDFYSVRAPVDPRLPNGGGYLLRGLSTQKQTGALPDNGTAIAIDPDLSYTWAGFDTNVVMRVGSGLRVSGGTSTGRSVRDTCLSTLDEPKVAGRDGNDHRGGCRAVNALQTNIRGNASYTIPRVDVLAGAVFQYRPGNRRTATLTYTNRDVIWEPGSEQHERAPCGTPTGPAGCFFNPFPTTMAAADLLDSGDLYGEGSRQVDLRFGKNIRIGHRRINVGVDVYNLFNSDAAISYDDRYTAWRDPATGVWYQGVGPDGGRDNPDTPIVDVQNWGQVTGVISPRFLRFQVQIDF